MGHVPLLDELAIVAALAVAVTVILSRLKLPDGGGAARGRRAARALRAPARDVGRTQSRCWPRSASSSCCSPSGSSSRSRACATSSARSRSAARCRWGSPPRRRRASRWRSGQPLGRGVFYGFVFALSSTAIVLRALAERRELDAPHGRFIVGTLIFQDLCVVPMVLIVPAPRRCGRWRRAPPSASASRWARPPSSSSARSSVSRFVVPKVLGWVDASRSREVFLLAILGLCIGTAWLTSLAGLSLALGAFLGGMVVADTRVRPPRDGRHPAPPRRLREHLLRLARHAVRRAGRGGAPARWSARCSPASSWRRVRWPRSRPWRCAFPSRVAWLAGVGLAQFGEFGFVLTRLAQSNGVIDEDATGPLLAAGIGSMFLTPLLVRAAPHITAGERLLAPLERLIGVRSIDEADEDTTSSKATSSSSASASPASSRRARFATAASAFVVLELNADNVRKGKELGLAGVLRRRDQRRGAPARPRRARAARGAADERSAGGAARGRTPSSAWRRACPC